MSRMTTLPTDSAERKEYSIGRGALAYFPAAIAGVARHSFKAGAKHTGGELVHKRWLSSDHDDTIERHLMDIRDLVAHFERGPEKMDTQLILDEADALAWRALALSQSLHERFGGAPLAPAARLQTIGCAPRYPQEGDDILANETFCQSSAFVTEEQLHEFRRGHITPVEHGLKDDTQ